MRKFRSLIISFLIVFALSIVGMELKGDITGAVWYYVGCGGALMIILVFNFILEKNAKKALDCLSVRQSQEELLEQHEKAKENFPSALRKMSRTVAATLIYIIAVALLSAAFCVFAGATYGFSLLVLPPFYFIFCVVDRMCCISFRPVHIDTINNSDYPVLMSIIDDVRGVYDVRGRTLFILPQNQCNAGIAEIPGGYSLMLGIPLVAVLDENELRQIMLHEFAHVKNKDTRLLFISIMLMNFMTAKSINPLGVINGMFRFASMKYDTAYSKYRVSSSIVSEENADAAILEYGDPEVFVSAMTKIAGYSYYMREERSNIYADNESLPEHVCTVNTRYFIEATEKRAAEWTELMKLELPALLSSHPTFNQRRVNMKLDNFELKLNRGGNKYREEWRRLAEFTDGRIRDQMKEDYGKKREKEYVKSLERVKEWESSDKSAPTEELCPVIDAYQALTRFEDAVALCDHIIESSANPNATAYPLYIKGVNLTRVYKAEGIKYLYDSMIINRNYISPGLNLIGDFSRIMGLSDELEKYRRLYPEMMQEVKDKYSKANDLKAGDKLTAETLDKDCLQKHIEYIRDKGGDKLTDIYLVRKVITDDFYTSAFVIRFDKKVKKDESDEIMMYIFNHFDTFPGEKQYSVFIYDKKTARAVRRVKNSRIYGKIA